MKKSTKLSKSKKTPPTQNSRTLNFIFAGIYAVQAALLIVLSKAVTVPVSTSYLSLDPLLSQGGKPVLAPATRNLFELNLTYLIVIIVLIAAITHLIAATTYRKQYEAGLDNGFNKARWTAWGVAAPLLLTTIALVCGIYDISTLLAIIVLTFIATIMGSVMNKGNVKAKQVTWLSFVVGCIVGFVPLLIISIYLWGASVFGSGLPKAIYWIFASTLLFSFLFVVSSYLFYKKRGKWTDYLYAERVYMILSLVATTALVWQIFAAILHA